MCSQTELGKNQNPICDPYLIIQPIFIATLCYINEFFDGLLNQILTNTCQKNEVQVSLKLPAFHINACSILLDTCSEQMTSCNNNQPIYKLPPPKYSAEQILKILLDPNIPENKICKEKPSGITCSATYVIDTNNLKCLDDVKKDEFGIWKYSGSHPIFLKMAA